MYILVSLFLLFLFHSRSAAQNCSVTACSSSSSSSVLIRFPFRLEGSQQPQNCGYPGFDLSCDSRGRTIMRLPHSGEFFVREINFPTQQIQLYDPGDCLPKRLLQLNLSNSPFSATYYKNLTFLYCPMKLTYSAIGCLGNSSHKVVASSDESFVKTMATVCSIMVTQPIPITWPGQYDQGPSDYLNHDLQLSWFTPDCIDCEMDGGICDFASNSSHNIGCFSIHPASTDRTGKGLLTFRIICLVIALPAIISSIGIGVFIRCKDRRRGSNRVNISVTPQPSIVTVGLDDTTVESFTKIVIGESLCLSGPNDIICPICLAEYRPKEILRYIPQCTHCFHAECIDQWLKLSTVCPVCRNSASPVPPNDT